MSFGESLTISIISSVIGFASAALVMVTGHLLSRFFLDPLVEMRKLVTELKAAIAVEFTGPLLSGKETDAALIKGSVDKLTGLCARLMMLLWSSPFYSWSRRKRLVPFRERVSEMYAQIASLTEVNASANRILHCTRVLMFASEVLDGKDYGFEGAEMTAKMDEYLGHLRKLMERDMKKAG